MAYRTKEVNPDYRRTAKTECYCGMCQRDLSAGTEVLYTAHELDVWTSIIHPADLPTAWAEIRPRRSPHHHNDVIQFDRIGPECARKIGRQWCLTEPLRG